MWYIAAGGVTKCIYSTSKSGVSTLHVYNLDGSTDQSTTYSFTCYVRIELVYILVSTINVITANIRRNHFEMTFSC